MKILAKLLRDETGLETVEYSILVGMIIGALIPTLVAIGVWVVSAFTTFQSTVGA